ncbi:intermembrane phospholipid transport protein YdbH family protein [Methylomonas rosea]|uniref:YdbH domain-containing protein n=1 Tax=Methylomonas rosea TaxID=2952227 RepID=A0ABT1TXL0_9GAMM|nr:YdbH domain-containing protein [Methylomonas sp. WSC-7]MCQ8119116.1 YdbH domain-containing protein [Methylomonas sp. WSC-7]
MKLSAGKNDLKRRSSLLRAVAITLLVLTLFCLAVWWQRAVLFELILQQALKHTALSSPSLSGLSFDYKQAKLAEISFGMATPAGDLAVAMQDVATDYDIEKRIIHNVSIGHAALKFNYRPTDQASTQTAENTPISLPLDRLSIAKLEIDIDTPWGLSSFAGKADIKRGAADAIDARFQDARQSLDLNIAPGFSAAKLNVERLPSGNIFELEAQQLDRPAKQISLHAGALGLIEWFSSSLLIPQTLRTKTRTYDVSKLNPLLSATQLSVNAKTADNFASLYAEAVLKRNKQSLVAVDMAMANKQTIDMNGRLDMAASEAFDLIKPWLPAMAASWTVAGGAVQGNLQLHKPSNQDASGAAQLAITDLALTAGAAKVEKAKVELNIPELANRAVDLSAEVPTLGLGKDLIARNLNVKARYVDQTLTLSQASLALFGGTMELMPDTIRLEQTPMLLTLRLHDVDLSQLLMSLNYPNISGTGTIAGELPLQLSAGAIDVQDGSISGTQPGVLRYVGPADNQNIAFKALRNLVYRNLQAKVNYRPNGDYHLGLRLEGNNPEVLSGHPLAFNLNISGQLPELLQRGILAGDLERTILEQAIAKPANLEKSPNTPTGDQSPKPPPADRRSQ